jgi:predicted ester cyclase
VSYTRDAARSQQQEATQVIPPNQWNKSIGSKTGGYVMNGTIETNKTAATRFIEAFNTDAWNTVHEVVGPNYVLSHPIAGTVKLGPEGMVAAWSGDKARVPDMWHPIPVMITEGDYLAVLLPTYGHFTGEPYHGTPPTGKWMEYGMVNIVRFEGGKLAEAWFGMDPLVEMQQMGAAPSLPPRQLSAAEAANLELFQQTINTTGLQYDNITAFRDVVIALGPPQHAEETTTRKVEIYRAGKGSLERIYFYEFRTDPPYAGDPSANVELSRALVQRFFRRVLTGHELDALAEIASPHILVHQTAMPCEASFYGISGASSWLSEQWESFPDLNRVVDITVAQGDIVAVRWTDRGTSKGNFLMLPPTGKVIEYTGVSMYRIEGEKIAEIWETRNTLGIMRQLNPEIGGGHNTH